MLNADDLTRMRGDVAQLLPGTAVIQQPAPIYNKGARSGEGLTPVTGGTVACRFDPPSLRDREQAAAGRENLVIDYVVTLPFDAPVDANYVISSGGKDYRIVALAAEHSWNASKRAYVMRAG